MSRFDLCRNIFKTLCLGMLLHLQACGSGNIADCDAKVKLLPCSEKTPDEKARAALDKGDYDTAISILSDLIVDEPEVYTRYSLLGAVYAARGGLSIKDILSAQIENASSSTDLTGGVIPKPDEVGDTVFANYVTDMNSAVTVLTQIPASIRDAVSGGDFGKNATFQLVLYQTAYSIMLLNKFAISATTGKFDPEKLATMSDAEAVEMINSLAASSELAQSSDLTPAQKASIDKTLTEINSNPGSAKEKIDQYMAAKNGM